MTFKHNWEKANTQHQLPHGIIEKMLQLAYPNRKFISHEVIAGGCANINIKIELEDTQTLILRVYLRDKDATYREQKLGHLLKQTVPIPLTYYIGEIDSYRFAITEFMPGIPLRELLLSKEPHDIGNIMQAVGELLANIATHHFPTSGFFDKNLNVVGHSSGNNYLAFAKECLQNQIVLSQLPAETISKINFCLNHYSHLFPNENEKHLVHADFDPANILVGKINGAWKVTGILDWEFSFAGSVLCDVANMLRYAHKMPSEFQDSFLKGLSNAGIFIPENWHTSIHMLNLISLLDILNRSDPQTRPKQCADVRELIDYILSELNPMQETDHLKITSDDPNWPNIFEAEATAINKALGLNGLRITKVSTPLEWKAAKHFRDKYFFTPLGIEDPYTSTFNHPDYSHLVLYQGVDVIGYASIQFWPGSRAALRIIAIDEDKRNRNAGSTFLALIEKWLKSLGVKSIHAESRQTSLRFYLNTGYLEMPFNDPEAHDSDPNDIPVGKIL